MSEDNDMDFEIIDLPASKSESGGKNFTRSLSESDKHGIKYEIIVKAATKSPPAISTSSPVRPMPIEVRCKKADEKRQSLELQVVTKCKEHEEKIVMAQRNRTESTESKQKLLEDQFNKKLRTSEELLAMQTESQQMKVAANAKRLEEARKLRDENVAAKIRDAEQKLAKTQVSEEIREKNLMKIKERQQEHSTKIKEGLEKVKESTEQKRKEMQQKEIQVEKNRESRLEERRNSLRKKHLAIEERLAEKKREKQVQG